MKKLIITLLFVLFGGVSIAFASPVFQVYQGGTGLQYPTTGFQTGKCLTGNGLGAIGTTTCGGSGGTNYFTNSGLNTYLNTGSNLEAPYFTATSSGGVTTINGTIEGPASIWSIGNGGMAHFNTDLFVGGFTALDGGYINTSAVGNINITSPTTFTAGMGTINDDGNGNITCASTCEFTKIPVYIGAIFEDTVTNKSAYVTAVIDNDDITLSHGIGGGSGDAWEYINASLSGNGNIFGSNFTAASTTLASQFPYASTTMITSYLASTTNLQIDNSANINDDNYLNFDGGLGNIRYQSQHDAVGGEFQFSAYANMAIVAGLSAQHNDHIQIGGDGPYYEVIDIEANGSSDGGIQDFTISNAGTSYQAGDVLTVSGGNGDCQITLTAGDIGAGGAIQNVSPFHKLNGCGTAYTPGLFTFSGGHGSSGGGTIIDVTLNRPSKKMAWESTYNTGGDNYNFNIMSMHTDSSSTQSGMDTMYWNDNDPGSGSETANSTYGVPIAALNVLGLTANTFTATSTAASKFPYASTTEITATTASSTNLIVSGISGSTQCLHASSSGVVSGTGSDCGSGGGSGTVNSGTTGQFPYYAANGTTLTATSTIFVSTNSNVGIATTSPWGNLSVTGSSSVGTPEFVVASSTNASTTLYANYYGGVSIGTTTQYGGQFTPLVLAGNNPNGDTNLLIDNAGCGSLANSNVSFRSKNVATGEILASGSCASGIDGGAGTMQLINFNNSPMRFYINDATPARLNITSSMVTTPGLFGIGTTSPWRTLSVNGSSDLGINALAGYFTATSTTASQFPYASSTAITLPLSSGEPSDLMFGTNPGVYYVPYISSPNDNQLDLFAGECGFSIESFNVDVRAGCPLLSNIFGGPAGTLNQPTYQDYLAPGGGVGINFPGNNIVGIDQNSIQAMQIDSASTTILSGLFGVGTSSPFAEISAASTTGPLLAVASSTANNSNGAVFEIDQNQHTLTSGPTPSLTSCGTSPSFIGKANDQKMIVQVGSVSATGCIISFAKAYATRPEVNVTNESMSVVNAMSYTVSPSAITVTQTGLTGDILDISTGGTQ